MTHHDASPNTVRVARAHTYAWGSMAKCVRCVMRHGLALCDQPCKLAGMFLVGSALETRWRPSSGRSQPALAASRRAGREDDGGNASALPGGHAFNRGEVRLRGWPRAAFLVCLT